MKKIRFLIALWASKACRLLLRLLKRKATSTPGKVGVAIDKNFLAGFQLPKTVIAVTGTNGKTTGSNLLTDSSGINVLVGGIVGGELGIALAQDFLTAGDHDVGSAGRASRRVSQSETLS